MSRITLASVILLPVSSSLNFVAQRNLRSKGVRSELHIQPWCSARRVKFDNLHKIAESLPLSRGKSSMFGEQEERGRTVMLSFTMWDAALRSAGLCLLRFYLNSEGKLFRSGKLLLPKEALQVGRHFYP